MAQMFSYMKRKARPNTKLEEEDDEGPKGYEGSEHVKYRDPGYAKHNIRTPKDEPHQKSYESRNEEHEAEDDYHMGIPQQTKSDLEKNIRRARMKMDAPNQQEPKSLRGNMVSNVPMRGVEDTSGEEMEGPNEMQSDSLPKEHRKKMIVSVMKKKMKKRGTVPGSEPSYSNDNLVNQSF